MTADGRNGPILVIGAQGKTGSRVVARLHERGLPVRGVSRSTHTPFDWDDEGTWPAALEGAPVAYVTFHPDISLPVAAERIGRLGAMARESGMDRAVLLSGRGEEGAEAAERALLAEMPDATVIRASWFMQNFSEGHFTPDVVAGELALPVPETGEPFVDCEDIADVVAVCLTNPLHGGQTYSLTGPALLSFADAARVITEASGRELRFARVTAGEYRDAMLAADVPVDVIEALTTVFTETLDGRNESLTLDVETVLGRPPRSLATFVTAEAAAGRWPRP